MSGPNLAIVKPNKPEYLPVLVENLPDIPGARWALWRAVLKDGRWSKPPCDTTGRYLRTNKPETWLERGEALAAYAAGGFDGVGVLVGGSGLVALDFDNARELFAGEARFKALATDIKRGGHYCERSPSGGGLRALVAAEWRGPGEKIVASLDGWTGSGKTPALETFGGSMFVSLTGQPVGKDWPLGVIHGGQSIADRAVALGRVAVDAGKVAADAAIDAEMATGRGEAVRREATAENRALVLAELAALASVDQRCSPSNPDREQWRNTVWSIVSLGATGADRAFWATVAHEWSRGGGALYDAAACQTITGGFNPDHPRAKGYNWVLSILRERGVSVASGAEGGAGGSVRVVRMTLDDIDKLPGAQFVVADLMPRGHVTLFAGHGSSGKSYVMLAIGVHVALGIPWGGQPVQQGRFMFVSLEDDTDTVWIRIKRILTAHKMIGRFNEVADNIGIIDGHDAGPMMTEVYSDGVRRVVKTSVYDRIKEEADKFKPDLIAIDNASDAFDGDENSRRQVRPFVRAIRAIGEQHNAAVVLLAHIDKSSAKFGSNGNSYSGSTAWHNSVRSRIALVVGDDDERRLVHEKTNHGAIMKDDIPIAWIDGCWKSDIGGNHRKLIALDREAMDDTAVFNSIRAVIAQGGEVRAAENGPSTAWHSLASRAEMGEELRAETREAKRRVKDACQRLADAGKIAREEFLVNRNRRQKWIIPSGVN